MKISAIITILSLSMSSGFQTASFEKQALASVQRILASSLDAGLPKRPFAIWFKELTGNQAGVVWQLTECGEPTGVANKIDQDLPACAEVNAVLPSGSKVVIVINVGTFKKGLNGRPAFFGAVVEHNDRLYQVRRLRDLPEMLHGPETQPVLLTAMGKEGRPVNLPGIKLNQALFKLPFVAGYLLPPSSSSNIVAQSITDAATPPAPVTQPQKMQTVGEGVLQGLAITRIKPVYPESARKMNAFGSVEVRIIISKEGRVMAAAAISGHMALRNAAVEAARNWVFKPATLDGVPVKAEGILTFVFARSAR
ncbi:MAG: energy transducer TonB [Acidobacteria bacterium]|nr:energy transducer TonB [Acidobacteriota bacterium]